MSVGLYGLTAPQFLLVYAVLLIAALGTSFWIAARLRPAGSARTLKDPDDIAVINKGRRRFAEMAVTRLVTTGVLDCSAKGEFSVRRRDAISHAVDGAIAAATPGRWPALISAAKPFAEMAERRLIANGMMMDDQAFSRVRGYQALPFLALLLFGGARWVVGVQSAHPVGFLTLLLIATLILLITLHLITDRRTAAGRDALTTTERRESRLRHAPMTDDLPTAVALFGTSVLIGSSYENVHKVQTASSGGGFGAGGGDSGGGDSGCGGGGCGG